jgi:hypothetical protein
MAKREVILGAALPALLLAACGSRQPAAAENAAAEASLNGQDNASASNPGEPEVSEGPGIDSVPPPDAVSHPEGYLPNSGDSPAGSEPEQPGVNSAGPRTPPPATEDEYIRNKQAGS